MIVRAQSETNSQNAHKSAGPKTEEGKKRSSLNALKHGLSGQAVSFAKIHEEAFLQRLDEWRTIYNPIDEGQEWFYHELVAESLRLEHCRMMIVDATADFARRSAGAYWEQMRRTDAIELASRLSKRPEVIAAKLRSTKYGCEYLAEHWDMLTRVLILEGDWTDEQKSLALDMLGVQECLRSAYHLFRIGVADEKGELLEERERFATELAAELRKLIETQYEADDKAEREAAMIGAFRSLPKPLATFQRYLKESFNRLAVLEDMLSKHVGLTDEDAPHNRETRRSSKHAGLKKRKPTREQLIRRLPAPFQTPDPFAAFEEFADDCEYAELEFAAIQEVMSENAVDPNLDLSSFHRLVLDRIEVIKSRQGDADKAGGPAKR